MGGWGGNQVGVRRDGSGEALGVGRRGVGRCYIENVMVYGHSNDKRSFSYLYKLFLYVQ